MAEEEYLIPIFLINGQLESGKTTFISEITEMGQFDDAKKKLLIVCEEGEVDYDEDILKAHDIDIVILNKDELTEEKLESLNKEYDPWVVIIEYNGMWDPKILEEVAMPHGWAVYQSITIMDAQKFQLQWKNMQGIMAETVKTAESVIFNRCSIDMDLGSFRRSMKALNPGVDVIFEDVNGEIITGVNSILPYDMTADVVKVEDEDFGIWFIDVRERRDEYNGKKFSFKAQVLKPSELDQDEFVASRHAMTCCENDIAVIGYICEYEQAPRLKEKDWVNVTVQVRYERKPVYNNEEGPILKVISLQPADQPECEVVSF